ncbi:hypothetical protein SDC9_102996 [bioreactor metagenome]|uniref:Uncharacterized protein n=1 Tax=bioreactor metagenome TaxID=1076179 RepID=A0A645B3A9_9ZZZZ
MGVALNLFVDIQRDVHETAVVPARRHGIHQQGKILLMVQVFVTFLHYFVQDTAHEYACFRLVAQAEVGREVQKMPALPQKAAAEGVDGGNLRFVHQCGLTAQMAISRLLGKPPGKGGGNAAPEFGRRCPCVGNNQKLVDVPPLPGHPVKEPLNQNSGFTRAGGGGHQKTAPTVGNGLTLFGCQRKSHGQCSSHRYLINSRTYGVFFIFSSTEAQNSSLLTDLR